MSGSIACITTTGRASVRQSPSTSRAAPGTSKASTGFAIVMARIAGFSAGPRRFGTTPGLATRFAGIADRHHGSQAGRWTDRTAESGSVPRSPRPRDQPHGRRSRDYQFALVMLGLDRFKTMNHSLGGRGADRLLVEVANRLQTCLRANRRRDTRRPRLHTRAAGRRRIHRPARRHR